MESLAKMRSFHQVLLFVIVFVVNGVYLLPEVETEAKAEVTVIEPVRVSDFIQVEDDMVDDEENEIYNEVSEAQDEVLKDDSKGWTLNRNDQGGYDLRIQSDDALRTESVRVAKVTEAREGKEVVDEASTVDESKTVHRVKGTSSWTDKDGVKTEILYEADENGYRAFGSAVPTPWPLSKLPKLLREGILLTMKVAEERKARGLDMPPRYHMMKEQRRQRRGRKGRRSRN